MVFGWSPRPVKAGFAVVAFALILAPVALAIQPGEWVQQTEADFGAGESDGTVVTNLGDVKLAASHETLAELSEEASIIYDAQVIDGMTYLAAGPEGKLLKWDGEEVTEVAAFKGEQVFALGMSDAGHLLLAISGETSRLAELQGENVVDVAVLSEVRYVWDVLHDDEAYIVATGTEGQVLRVVIPAQGDAEVEPILDAEQVNILCLSRQGADGPIYAGTDTDGLVYRLTKNDDNSWSTFVLYDAAEPEIGALLVREDGTVFAGTADANQARPGRLDEPVADEAGRPEAGAAVPTEVGEDDGEGDGDMPAPDPGDLPEVPPAPTPIGDGNENTPDGESTPAPGSAPGSDGPATEPGDAEEAQPAEANSARAQPARDTMAQDATDAQNVATDSESNSNTDATASQPTAEQRDRLRELVRSRLDAARKSGKLQSPGGMPGGPGGAARARAGAPRPPAAGAATQEGNAIYRIDAQGFVTEVFRESVMILRIIETPGPDNRLLVATGSEAQLFRIDPADGETTIVADLEPEQIPTMIATDDGVLLGTANPAELVRLGDTLATRGTYTSAPLDATQVSLWGTMRLTADIPDGASVTIETRSGNVADPEVAPWSDWSDAQVRMPNAAQPSLQPRQVSVAAPPARFLQYRLTLTASADGTSPTVDRVSTMYVTPNLRPKIAAIRATYPDSQPLPSGPGAAEAAPPTTAMNVEWEAADPNNDRLLYTLEYQRAGAEAWVAIAEDVEGTTFEWQTRRAPDGWYLLHVIASDRLDNPPDMAQTATRRSGPVLVDNTAPAFENVKSAVDGDKTTITGEATDQWSPIRSIAYAVDSAELYNPILPKDLIFDSTRESFTVTIPDLAPGAHVVTLRVADTRGNIGYHAVTLNPRK